MDDDQIDKQIREGLQQEQEKLSTFRFNIDKDFLKQQGRAITEKRDLFKHITLISSAMLGLIIFVPKDGVVQGLLMTGIVLHALVIALAISYIRELIDGLKKLQDKYNQILHEKEELIIEYLKKDVLSVEDLKEYHRNLRSTPLVQELIVDKEASDEERKKRVGGAKENGDYFGEFIVFLFLSAFFFIFLSFYSAWTWCEIAIGLLIIFIFSFFSFSSLISKIISWPMNFTRK